MCFDLKMICSYLFLNYISSGEKIVQVCGFAPPIKIILCYYPKKVVYSCFAYLLFLILTFEYL